MEIKAMQPKRFGAVKVERARTHRAWDGGAIEAAFREVCGERKVYGLEELLIMGYVTIPETRDGSLLDRGGA